MLKGQKKHRLWYGNTVKHWCKRPSAGWAVIRVHLQTLRLSQLWHFCELRDFTQCFLPPKGTMLSTRSYWGSGGKCTLPNHLSWMCLAAGMYCPLQHKSFGCSYSGDNTGAECWDRLLVCPCLGSSFGRRTWDILAEGIFILKLHVWTWKGLQKNNFKIYAICLCLHCSLGDTPVPEHEAKIYI